MTGMIIPLQSMQPATSALAAFDIAAIELLLSGRAVTLSGARLSAIRDKLVEQRAQLATVIADLRTRPPSGDLRIDAVNATLCAEADTGLAYLDLFLGQVETCASRVA